MPYQDSTFNIVSCTYMYQRYNFGKDRIYDTFQKKKKKNR